MKKEGYIQNEYHQKVKRYCQTLDLKDDAELIARYREAHSKSKAWPEIAAGIRQVGILEMEMYILGNKVFMIIINLDLSLHVLSMAVVFIVFESITGLQPMSRTYQVLLML